MKTYNETRAEVVKILNNSDINANEFMRICKDLCTCSQCKYYCQHYDANGKYVDYGHCVRNKGNHPTRPYITACGFWDCDKLKGRKNEVNRC